MSGVNTTTAAATATTSAPTATQTVVDDPDSREIFVVTYESDFFSSTIHLYGLCRQRGNPKVSEQVHVAVSGVHPIVYVPFPPCVEKTTSTLQARFQFASSLRGYCRNKLKTNNGQAHVLAIGIDECKRAVGFRNDHTVPMLKLTLNSPWAVKVVCKDFSQRNLRIDGYHMPEGLHVYHYTAVEHEAARRYNLGISRWNIFRNLKDISIDNNDSDGDGNGGGAADDDDPSGGADFSNYSGSSGGYKRRSGGGDGNGKRKRQRKGAHRTPTADYMYNYKCSIGDVAAKWDDNSIPLDVQVCVYDIEADGLYPAENAAHQIVGVIVNLMGKVVRAVGFTRHDVDIKDDLLKTLRGREEMMGVPLEIQKCDSETEMIRMFWEFAKANSMLVCDYNGHFYDFPFMATRCPDMPLGRLSNARSKNQMGSFVRQLTFAGLPDLDMCEVARKRFSKLDVYTLDFVVKHALKKVLKPEDLGKDDVTPEYIIEAFTSRKADMCGKVLVYCLWDVILTMKLMTHLNQVVGLIELSRLISMPLGDVVMAKSEARVFSQVMKRFMDRGYVLNVPFRPFDAAQGDGGGDGGGKARAKFQGATVLEPVKGFHKGPTVTFDFDSLYPNIMIKNNLCTSSVVISGVNLDEPGIQVAKAPHNDNFLFATNVKATRKPVIPEILDENIVLRKATQAEMKKWPKDSHEYKQADAKQYEIKIHNNSTYGVFGFQGSILYMEQIASTVTAFGRLYIATAVRIVCETYDTPDKKHATVLYGDTDSIMILFSEELIATKMPTAEQFPQKPGWPDVEYQTRRRVYASKELAKPIEARILAEVGIRMKYEGCKLDFLLPRKKGYAATIIEQPDEPSTEFELKLSGLDVVRHDQPGFVRVDLRKAIENLVSGKIDISGLIVEVMRIADKICSKDVDLDYFVLTVGFNREDYDNEDGQISIQVRNRMNKSMPQSTPQVGDRIKYVVVQGPTTSVAANARHVLEMPKVREPIDTIYYLRKLDDKIRNIFECVPGVTEAVGAYVDKLVRKLKPPCRLPTGQMTFEQLAARAAQRQAAAAAAAVAGSKRSSGDDNEEAYTDKDQAFQALLDGQGINTAVKPRVETVVTTKGAVGVEVAPKDNGAASKQAQQSHVANVFAKRKKLSKWSLFSEDDEDDDVNSQ